MYTISTSQKILIEWHNESTQKPPKQAVYVHESNAADILKNAHAQTAFPQRQASLGSDEKARPQVV